MKKWIILTLSAVTFGLSGCGSKSDDGGGAGAPVSPWAGAGVCQPGQLYTQYGCLNQGFCPGQQAQYGNTCVPATQPPIGTPIWGVPGQTQGTSLYAHLQISDPRSFERLIKFAGACREYRGFWFGWNGFQRYSIKCRDFSYMGRIQVQISNPVDGATAYVQISGMSERGQTISVNIPMVYQAIRGNQGFTLYDRGNFNFPSPRIRVTSTSGSIATGQAEINVSFDGYEFAHGNLRRY